MLRRWVKRKITIVIFSLSLLISSKTFSRFDSYCNDSPKIERLLESQIYNSEIEIISNSEVVVELRGGGNIDIWLWIAILEQLLKESQAFTRPNSNNYPSQTSFGEINPAVQNKDPSPRIAHKKSIDPVNRNHPSKRKTLSIEEGVDIDYEYKKIKDLGIECSQERFNELSTNTQTGNIDSKSIIEANGGLRAESKGLVKGLRRPKNPEIDLDFEVIGPFPYSYMDIKTPIDFNSLGVDVSHFPSYEKVGESIGKKLISQKSRFCDELGGPVGPENVLHVVDLSKCPPDQVEVMKYSVIKGAGSSIGIEFLF